MKRLIAYPELPFESPAPGVVLSRYDSATMTAAASASISWTIAPASLRGAIYYWTASKAAQADGGAVVSVGPITRMAPGTGAQPVQLNSGRCMGCHAVSADGTTLVAAIDDPATAPADPPYVLGWQKPNYTRPWAVFDVSQQPTQAGYQSTQYGADIAITPDGAYTVWGAPTVTDGGGSRVPSLSNTKTGELVTSSGLDALLGPLGGDLLSMPAFSPDGTMLAAVRSPSSGDNVLPVNPKSIVYVGYAAGSQSFGAIRSDRGGRVLVGRVHEHARLGQHGVSRSRGRGRHQGRELQAAPVGGRGGRVDRHG
jgi:WD40-like Beta Propeller Repeat